jgi:hypothetical protein
VANSPELHLLVEQVMNAAPVMPEFADLIDQLSSHLGDEAERWRSHSDAMRSSVEKISRPSRRTVEDAIAAGFRSGKAAALTDEAERWSGLAYALRHGWSVADAETATDAEAAFLDRPPRLPRSFS